MQPVVGDEGDGAPPQRDVLVDGDVGSADGGELSCCHCVHVGEAAEAVREMEDLRVAAWSKVQRIEVVDADGDTVAVG